MTDSAAEARPTPLHIVLLQPEIPHNTGAIGRLCVGLDCDLALVRPLGFVLSDAYLRRAGLDYWPHLRLAVHDNWDAFLRDVRPQRLHFLSTHGGRSLYEARFLPGDTLVFGCESAGLPPPFYDRYRDALLRIPMPGPHARSLNLANAVSVAAYEAYRQISRLPTANAGEIDDVQLGGCGRTPSPQNSERWSAETPSGFRNSFWKSMGTDS